MTVLPPLHRGDTRTIRVRNALDADNQALNFDLYTVRFSAKRATDAVPLISKSSPTEIVVLALGNADILILPADTDSLERKTELHWDVEVSSSTEDVWTIASGTWEIVMDVTR